MKRLWGVTGDEVKRYGVLAIHATGFLSAFGEVAPETGYAVCVVAILALDLTAGCFVECFAAYGAVCHFCI